MNLMELLASHSVNAGVYWDPELGYRSYTATSTGRTYADITVDEVCAIHSLLPELISWLSTESQHKRGLWMHVPSATILKTLSEWVNPIAPLRDAMGESYHVEAIHSCERDTDETLLMHCSYYETQEWRPAGYQVPVKVLFSYGTTTMAVHTAMMENDFPGWYERYQNGVAIGVDERTLARYTFGAQSPLPQVSMTGVEFAQP